MHINEMSIYDYSLKLKLAFLIQLNWFSWTKQAL